MINHPSITQKKKKYQFWLPLAISAAIIVLIFLFLGNLEAWFTDLLNKARQHRQDFVVTSYLVLSADIVLPVPSSIVMFMNGFVLGTLQGGLLSLVSLLSGSLIGYSLGRFTSFRQKQPSTDSSSLVRRYGVYAVLVTRGIPILSESVSIACGYNKMPLKLYFIMNLAGYLPLCYLYSLCGHLGYNQSVFLIGFGFSLLITAFFWFLRKKINPNFIFKK